MSAPSVSHLNETPTSVAIDPPFRVKRHVRHWTWVRGGSGDVEQNRDTGTAPPCATSFFACMSCVCCRLVALPRQADAVATDRGRKLGPPQRALISDMLGPLVVALLSAWPVVAADLVRIVASYAVPGVWHLGDLQSPFTHLCGGVLYEEHTALLAVPPDRAAAGAGHACEDHEDDACLADFRTLGVPVADKECFLREAFLIWTPGVRPALLVGIPETSPHDELYAVSFRDAETLLFVDAEDIAKPPNLLSVSGRGQSRSAVERPAPLVRRLGQQVSKPAERARAESVALVYADPASVTLRPGRDENAR